LHKKLLLEQVVWKKKKNSKLFLAGKRSEKGNFTPSWM